MRDFYGNRLGLNPFSEGPGLSVHEYTRLACSLDLQSMRSDGFDGARIRKQEPSFYIGSKDCPMTSRLPLGNFRISDGGFEGGKTASPAFGMANMKRLIKRWQRCRNNLNLKWL